MTSDSLKSLRIFSAPDQDSLIASKREAVNRSFFWGLLETVNLIRLDSCSPLLSTERDCAVRTSPFLRTCVGFQNRFPPKAESPPQIADWNFRPNLNVIWKADDEYRYVLRLTVPTYLRITVPAPISSIRLIDRGLSTLTS